VYALVAFAALRALGPTALADSAAPLADVVREARLPALVGVVVAGAVVAAGSVLLSVLVGVSRTGLAMARRSDLPSGLAGVGRTGTPWRADLAGGTVAAVLVLALRDPTSSVGVSAFCVLVYYAVANAAALRLTPDERRWPVALRVLGLVGCVVLAVTLPLVPVLVGASVLAVGLAVRAVLRRAGVGSGR
jgi:APA family basic amino acid/polyamine antiporter